MSEDSLDLVLLLKNKQILAKVQIKSGKHQRVCQCPLKAGFCGKK